MGKSGKIKSKKRHLSLLLLIFYDISDTSLAVSVLSFYPYIGGINY